MRIRSSHHRFFYQRTQSGGTLPRSETPKSPGMSNIMNKLLKLVTSTLKKNWRHFLSCRQFLILPEHAVVRTESPFLPALFHSDSKYFPHSLLLYFSLYPFSFSLILFFYSVLSAVTGSLFAAFLDGMIPPSRVSPILKRISTIAGSTGKNALILLLSATA